MKKQLALGLVALSSIAVLTACNQEIPKTEILIDEKSELKEFAYSETSVPVYYSGVVDYGHEIQVKDVKEDEEKVVVTSLLLLDDLSGIQPKEDLTYTITQTIRDNNIIETIHGKDDYFLSLIPDKVILQTPLEEGHKWTQDVTLEDGKDIQAETVIESITTNENGKRLITTNTTFVGGEVLTYPKDSYYERVTYEEGKGLISFEKPSSPEVSDYIFSYELVEENTEK